MLDPVIDRPPPMASEVHRKKVLDILPNEKQMGLQKEPQNSLTRLLAAAIYVKLKRRYSNEGMQLKAVEKIPYKWQSTW